MSFSSSWRMLSSMASPRSLDRSKEIITIREKFPLVLENQSLPELNVTFEQWGDPKLPDERTILILPSFSHSSHASSNQGDPRPGWWQEMIGPRKAINTSIFRVICPAMLGGPFGTTSPLSIDPTTGTPYRARFPQITPADMARAHAKVLDVLNIKKVHAVIGGSLGGMQGLEFAAQFPHRLDRLCALNCTAQTTPGTVAFRRVQRLAILADPQYQNGNYDLVSDGGRPLEGMKIARELGMTCYRSREEFDARFDWRPVASAHFSNPSQATFDVENYMDYQGRKFARVFDPNCYLLLSKAADLMNISDSCPQHNMADGLERIVCDTLLVGVEQDMLTPIQEQECIVEILKAFGRSSELVRVNSKYGHDAMFHPGMQQSTFSPVLKNFLQRGLEHLVEHEHQRYSTL